MNIAFKSVYIEITDRCNLHCPYCFNNSKASNTNDMSLELFEKITDECHELGIKEITLSGGEPLISKNFSDIIKSLKQKDFDIKIITNGTLFDKEKYKLLKNLGCSFQLTFDSPNSESHDKTRGHGSYQKNIDLIKRFIEDKIRFTVRFNIKDDIYFKPEEVVCLVKELSVTEFYFSYIKPIGRGKNEHTASDSRILEIINYIKENDLEKEFPNCLHGIHIDITDGCPFYNPKRVDFSPRINSIGDVFPCSICDVDELMLGNIKKQTLKEISESEKLSSFIKKCQSRYSSFGKCSKCVIKGFCKRPRLPARG